MSNRLNEVEKRLSETEGLSKLSPDAIEDLRSRFAGLPEEYTLFLERIGFGGLEGIQLYSGLISPTSVYPHPRDDLSQVVLFGDDFQGYCFGFDTKHDFALIEVDPRGRVCAKKEEGFLALIESYLPP